MASRFHFVSGLPRSGSTLLNALLKQNPRFSAAMTSPMVSLIGALMQNMSASSQFSVFFDDERRRAILRATFESYYAGVQPGHVAFDTNRTWTGKLALLHDLYPEARVICCVRDIGWIVDSMERMLRKNPLEHSRVFGYKPGNSVYSRAETLMSEAGLIGLALNSLREAWYGEMATSKLIVVKYDSLVREPAATLERLYDELGEASFEHDFDNVHYDEPEYDAQLGMPGMHKIDGKVEYRERERCIPPDLFGKYSKLSFWDDAEANSRGILIL